MEEKKFIRGAGILMPITSLPSAYGIGTLGEEAYRFIDLLVKMRQRYWQVLPIGPTSFGDSPYQGFSAFAGNPYLIDLDALVHDNLLKIEEIRQTDWGEDKEYIDYNLIFKNRFLVLNKAFKRFDTNDAAYIEFVKENDFWLRDYSIFMALKNKFNNSEWIKWDKEYRDKDKEAIAQFEKNNNEQIQFWKFSQYKFFEQWDRLRKYADAKGVEIIGDMPLYMAYDSADVWANTDKFLLDEKLLPKLVAGCPPDRINENGQKWGNPIYDWKKMEEDNFLWWQSRIKMNTRLFHIFRINQFMGIVRYYGIPYNAKDATLGKWYKGPAKKMVDIIQENIFDSKVIPEDLGIFIPVAKKLIKKNQWPEMKILQFAFDSGSEEEYLPHNYKSSNIIVYGGTHDNDTIVSHFGNKSEEELGFLYEYLNIQRKDEIPDAIIRLAYSSIADVVIFQMQDILKLDNSSRMNYPSTVGSNWRWRLWKDSLNEERIEWLRRIAYIYRR